MINLFGFCFLALLLDYYCCKIHLFALHVLHFLAMKNDSIAKKNVYYWVHASQTCCKLRVLYETDCFVYENNRPVHVQCGVVVIDSRSYAACDVYTSTRQIVSIETFVNSPLFHAVDNYLRL